MSGTGEHADGLAARGNRDGWDGSARSIQASTAPDRAGLVLLALILVAAVANLNLSVANVALPSIGEAFDSSQTTLNLIAVGLLAGSRRFGAVPGGAGRPLRAQAHADPRA